jgi:hypothetical protein
VAVKRKPTLAGRTASVEVSRNGATIRLDDVPADQAGTVLGDLLTAFRILTKKHPELIVQLDAIGGGGALEVNDGDEYETKEKRVGF